MAASELGLLPVGLSPAKSGVLTERPGDPVELPFVSPCCPDRMAAQGGWEMSRFLRLQKIGRGFASQVYMAVDILTNIKVALKVYHKPSLSAATLRGVNMEVSIHGRLAHPHILGMYAAFEDAPYLCIVSGLAEDGDLYRRLPEIRQDEGPVVKHIVGPLLSAIASMHQSSVIHRDLKPENVLLQGSHVLLTDFGFSVCLAHHRPLTRLGTLHFMAPEVLLNDTRERTGPMREQVPRPQRNVYGPSVDVWALGVIAFECLLHRAPFNGPDDKAVVKSIIAGKPRYDEKLSPGARDFLEQCLTFDASVRATAYDLYSHPWVIEHMPNDKWEALHPDAFRLAASALLSYSEGSPSAQEMRADDARLPGEGPAPAKRPAGSLAVPSGEEPPSGAPAWRVRGQPMHSRLNPASRANSGASNDSVGPSTDVLSRAQQAFAANQAAQAAAAAAGGAAAGAGNGGAGRFGAGHFIPSSALGATVERSSHSLPHGAAPPLGPPPALRGIPPSAALGGAGGLSATLGAPGQSAALPSGLDSSTHVLPWDQGGLAPTVKRPHGGSLTVLPGSGGVDRGSPGGSAGARLVGSGAGETPLSATSHWSAAGGNVSSDSHSPAVSRGVSSRLKKGSKAPEGSVGEGRREKPSTMESLKRMLRRKKSSDASMEEP